MISNRKKIILYIFFFLLIAYLVMGTGMVSDDFAHVQHLKDKPLKEVILIDSPGWILLPAEHLLILSWYKYFDINDPTLVGVVKSVYLFLAFCMIAAFFRIFLRDPAPLLVSFLFIFFPSHDSTAYWFLGYYLTISVALYLFAFYLAHKNRLGLAFIAALIGSFISYGSSILALSLSLVFIFRKEIKRALVLLVPNILFVAYYLILTKFLFPETTSRIPTSLNPPAIASAFAIQVASFLDAVIGPSMWLKIYYGFAQLSPISIVMAIVTIAVFYYMSKDGQWRTLSAGLTAGLVILTLLSFMMFASTGRYWQIAFNLGNRVTIFGSLLVAYLAIVFMPRRPLLKIILISVIVFTIFGISDHWKKWETTQQDIMARIRANKDISSYNDSRPIYISGNQYSKYGPLSNIELFSMESVACPFFDLASGKPIIALTINRRLQYADGKIIDTKFAIERDVDNYIVIYDSQKDMLLKVDEADINGYVDSLPIEKRHWIQMVDNSCFDSLLSKVGRLKECGS